MSVAFVLECWSADCSDKELEEAINVALGGRVLAMDGSVFAAYPLGIMTEEAHSALLAQIGENKELTTRWMCIEQGCTDEYISEKGETKQTNCAV